MEKVKVNQIRFQNLEGQDCLTAIEAVKANSKVLLATAEQAATSGNYGVARSLVILGSEEFIKGIILYLNNIGVRVYKIDEIKRALSSHKERHEIAIIIKFFKLIDIWTKVEEHKATTTTPWDWLNKAISIMDKAGIIFTGLEEVGSDLDWWLKADDYKNAGLYVDYKDLLILPKEVTEQDYLFAKAKVKDLTNRFNLFQIALERATTKEKKEIVKILNEAVDLYVSSGNENKRVKAKSKASVGV